MNAVAPLVVNPDIILLEIAGVFTLVVVNKIPIVAPVPAFETLLATVVLPIVLPVTVPILTKLAPVAEIPVNAVAPVPARVIP